MALELRGIEKRFGIHHAVRPTDLTIREGELFSLLGPSGCGKTTLLRMIAGFEEPTAGRILLDGADVTRMPPNRRPFNLVFQRYALFPHLSVLDNVAFGLRMKGERASEARSRAGRALALTRMESFASRAISTLSGGQQQRVALARALVNEPKVLLLDEPLSALDLKLRQAMQVELLALHRKLGHIFVFVTHDQEEALTLSDRIAVMNGGVIEQIGTPTEIYDCPATPFVARFIGSINSFPSVVRERRGQELAAAWPGSASALVARASDALTTVQPGASVEIMVRPEKLKISAVTEGAVTGMNHVEGRLRDVLFLGPTTQYLVEVHSGDSAATPIQITRPSQGMGINPQAGDRVRVSWSAEDALVMPASAPSPEAPHA